MSILIKPPLGRKPKATPIRKGLVLDLPMLGAGDLNDYSLNGNDGVNNGAEWVDGENGTALSTSNNNNVTLPESFDFTKPYTLIVWHQRLHTDTGWHQMFSQGNDFQFSMIGSNVWLYSSGGVLGASISVGEYSCDAVSGDGTTKTIWHNGEFVNSASGVASQIATPKVGSYTNDLEAHDGKISRVLLYDHVLSAQEIKSLYDDPWQAWRRKNIALWAAQGGVPPTGFEAWYAINANNLIGAA